MLSRHEGNYTPGMLYQMRRYRIVGKTFPRMPIPTSVEFFGSIPFNLGRRGSIKVRNGVDPLLILETFEICTPVASMHPPVVNQSKKCKSQSQNLVSTYRNAY